MAGSVQARLDQGSDEAVLGVTRDAILLHVLVPPNVPSFALSAVFIVHWQVRW